MFSTILVATDGSPESLEAVRAAAEEALRHHADLHTICVTNPGAVQSMFAGQQADVIDINYELITEFLAEEAKKALENAEKEAERIGGVSVTPHPPAWGGDPQRRDTPLCRRDWCRLYCHGINREDRYRSTPAGQCQFCSRDPRPHKYDDYTGKQDGII
ncbi:universal stress protein [Methanogenium cariaci]|uniref:universal stress protein n=1 Tax=Methanogenium cariaci TaxID=2197 RepID=UPI000782F86A|nr:universal stress protein [Methanogenium cariaci]